MSDEYEIVTHVVKVRDINPELADLIDEAAEAWRAYLASLPPEEAERERAAAILAERRLFFGDPS